MSFKILGTGSYAPEHVVTNDDLSALVDTNDEWITQRIGVRSPATSARRKRMWTWR